MKFHASRHVPKSSVSDRFWDKVKKCGRDECWPWKAAINSNGYGSFGENGKIVTASRICYQLTYGAIPPGAVVMHTCDNPRCSNPSHLRLGTKIDNIYDMIRKGRSKVIIAKLTEEQIR